MIHPEYMPFTAEELMEHFTGDAVAHVAYFEKSAARYAEFLSRYESPLQPISRSRAHRQIEKDERFWTVAALKTVFDHPERVRVLAELLARAFGERPPLPDLSSWKECLSGGDLHLFFEAQLPSPFCYTDWISQHLPERHLVPYVFDAAAAAGSRLEGATHVDAILVNSGNGFGLLVEAKVLSDISATVSFDCLRNQLARNIDVLLERQETLPPPLSTRVPERSLLALLTPAIFRRRPKSRLYGWLMREYQRTRRHCDGISHTGRMWPGMRLVGVWGGCPFAISSWPCPGPVAGSGLTMPPRTPSHHNERGTPHRDRSLLRWSFSDPDVN